MHATYIRPRYLPQLQNSTASQGQYSLQNFADTAFESSRRVLFLVAVTGQWAFLYYIVAFMAPPRFKEILRPGARTPFF